MVAAHRWLDVSAALLRNAWSESLPLAAHLTSPGTRPTHAAHACSPPRSRMVLITLEYPECHPAHRLHDVCCASCLPHAARCMVRVPCACMHSVPVCSGRRPASCTLLRNAQVEATEADEATVFPPEVRSTLPPAVVARYRRPCLLYRPCTAIRTPPAEVMHAHAHIPALWNAPHQGAYGWVGYNGVIPPHRACAWEHDVTACTACGRVRWYVHPAAHSASVAHVHMH